MRAFDDGGRDKDRALATRTPPPPARARAAAIAAHPELCLEEYNLAPTLTYAKLPHVLLRTGVTPEAPPGGGGAPPIVDAAVTSAPFTSVARLTNMVPVLGLASVRHHIIRAVHALRGAGGTATPVSVPFTITTDDPEAEPPLRAMMFIPDLCEPAPGVPGEAGAPPPDAAAPAPGASHPGGGWIMSEDRWEGRLDRSGMMVGGEVLAYDDAAVAGGAAGDPGSQGAEGGAQADVDDRTAEV